MTSRQSAATERALKLVAGGMTCYAAAKREKLAFSTVYRARNRQRKEARNEPGR